MAYYRTCEFCGTNLDPGERCDCREEYEDARVRLQDSKSPVQPKKLRNVS